MKAGSTWKPPPPRRLRAVLERLRGEYGRPVAHPHRAPIDELVLTVLSQNTNDRNRDVAYGRLRDRFDSWHEVRDAPVEEVEDAIRPGGLAPTKAARIQNILRALDDDLGWLESAPLAEAREFLCGLPGVGRKTAACILLFSYGRPDVPVDTHVYRVGTRLGLFRPGAPLEEAHDEMLRLSRGADPYEAHVALIRHGRRICVARTPRCGECPLRRMCLPAQLRVSQARRGLAVEGALVCVAAVWGLTFVMVQDAIELLPTLAFLGYRFLIATLLVALVFRRRLRALSTAGWRVGLVMGALLTAGYILQTYGLEETTASNAGFITGLFVVLTPVLGSLLLGDRVPRIAWIAAGVSAVGLYLLSGAGGGLNLRGDGLVLLCAIAFAGHILATARGAREHDVGALLVVQLGLCALVCLGVAAPLGQLQAPEGATVWSALLVTAVIASALGFFVQTYAQQHAPPARTALILASEPAFAGVFGWLLADERLSALSLCGAALILLAIVAVEAVPRMRPRRPLPEG